MTTSDDTLKRDVMLAHVELEKKINYFSLIQHANCIYDDVIPSYMMFVITQNNFRSEKIKKFKKVKKRYFPQSFQFTLT